MNMTSSLKGFLEGGLASIVAGCSTHPFDVIKLRMQLLEPSESASLAIASSSTPFGADPFSIAFHLVQTEGLHGLFTGLSATVLRQSLYSSTRMGVYEILKYRWRDPSLGARNGGLSVFKKVAAGLIAGGVGAVIGNPADVAMVRMQADALLPVGERRNYKDVVDALRTIVKQEGFMSLWTGSLLTVQRAMVVTACQLGAYDQIKESLLRNRLLCEGAGLYVAASLVAGVMAAAASNPIDVVRTRIMTMKMEPGCIRPYASPLDCAVKTVQQEGGLALYRGFIPSLTKQGPFTIVLFLTLEHIRRLLKNL